MTTDDMSPYRHSVIFFHTHSAKTADLYANLFMAAVSNGASADEARTVALRETARHAGRD